MNVKMQSLSRGVGGNPNHVKLCLRVMLDGVICCVFSVCMKSVDRGYFLLPQLKMP